jgi:uncharacterized protein YcfJ
MLKYALLLLLPLTAFAEEPMRYEIKDHYKTVVMKKPYQVEECEERLVGGDKTGDTLGGAIVGAAIGNAIGKDTEATVAGAAVGGLIGHNKSKRRPYYQMDCKIITRYERTEKEVYSHSTIKFTYEGVTYHERFDKGL